MIHPISRLPSFMISAARRWILDIERGWMGRRGDSGMRREHSVPKSEIRVPQSKSYPSMYP